ncbi:MAG: hypothetical protein AAGC55_28290, partial [Myxococcota bacterium]
AAAERGPGEPPRAEQRGGLTLLRLSEPLGGRTAYALIDRAEETEHQSGWDSAVLVPGAPGPVIEVPRPRTESPTAEAALVLCQRIECRAIIIAGIDSADGGRTAGDALAHPRASFPIAGQQLRSAAVVQLRGDRAVTAQTGVLHLHHKLPAGIDLDRLWPDSDNLELIWTAPPGPSRTWLERGDLLVLRAHPDTWWQSLIAAATPAVADIASSTGPQPQTPPGTSPRHDDLPLTGWLTATFEDLGSVGTEQTVLSQTEAQFIESMLARRLLDRRPERIGWLDRLAGLIDYRVVTLPACTDRFGCWVLTESAVVTRVERAGTGATPGTPHLLHRWGTLAVRIPVPKTGQGLDEAGAGAGAAEAGEPAWDGAPIAVEAPRPLLEGGTWQLAAAMWRQLDGQALIVGHDVPATHGISALEPTQVGNVITPFQAMHLATYRALVGRSDPFIAQVRGYATWRGVEEPLL